MTVLPADHRNVFGIAMYDLPIITDAAAKADFGSELFHAFKLSFQLRRLPPVVGIEERNPISARQSYSGIASGTHPGVLLAQYLDSIAEPGQFLVGAVSRSI